MLAAKNSFEEEVFYLAFSRHSSAISKKIKIIIKEEVKNGTNSKIRT